MSIPALVPRQEFPLLQNNPELVYLDSAATSQKPTQVLDAIAKFYANYNANVHRGLYPLSETATQLYEDARARVANFLGAKTNEVIFNSGTTAGANFLAHSLLRPNLAPGDVIISSLAEHHSNFLPFQAVARERGAKLEFFGVDSEFEFDLAKLEEILKNKGQQIKYLCLSAVSNVLGSSLNLHTVVALRDRYSPDALILLDAAQLVGHTGINVQALGADFLYFSAHKLFGETGCGVLWGRAELLEELSPSALGGGTVNTVTKVSHELKPVPERFEPGTPPICQAYTLGSACDFVEELTFANIATHEQELSDYTRTELAKLPDIKLYASKTSTSILAFSIGSIHAHDVASFLGDKQIAVRSGQHCTHILHGELQETATIRVSLHVYNSSADIDKLVAALRACQEYYGSPR